MSSVTFPPAIGGDGSTVTDDSSAITGLANGGHRTRFVPALAQLVAIAQWCVTAFTAYVSSASTYAGNANTSANNAAASAASALSAPGTSATVVGSIAAGTGSKSFTLDQTGKSFVVGQYVAITQTAAPTNWMAGPITAFTPGTGAITVNVITSNGGGSLSGWTVAPSPPVVAVPATPDYVIQAQGVF